MPTTPLHEQRSHLRSHQTDLTSDTRHTRHWHSRARRRISEGVMSVFRELVEWYRALLSCIPGETGCTLRNRLYGFHGGPHVRVLPHVLIYHPSKLVIGARTGIAAHCQINAGGEIDIGSDVLIGPNVMIWSQNHVYESRGIPINCQGYRRAKVVIEDDVWIGAGAIILPGVCLARGTVVAAGAVVTKSTLPYTIVGGVPARPIGSRCADHDECTP